MPSITNPFRKQDALIVLLAGTLVLLYVAMSGGGFPLDDSWIHQVYARNLARYGEWAFIPGQLSAASSSPLYTVVLSLGYVLNVNYALWTNLMGTLALAMTGIIASRMAGRLLPRSFLAGLVTGLVVVLSWHLTWAAASGMETMLFSMLVLALMALSWRELDERSSMTRPILLRGAVFGTVAALTTLARPEGVFLAGLIGLTMLAVRPHGSWRGVILWGIGSAVVFLVVLAPYLLLNLSLTGGLLPDTAAAKQAQNAWVIANFSLPRRLWEMIKPLLAGGQIMLVPGLLYFLVMLRHRREGRRAWIYMLPLFWTAGLIVLYAVRLPAPYQHGRYVIPVLPGLILSGMIGTFGLLNWGRTSPVRRVLTRTVAIATLLTFVYFAFLLGPGVFSDDVHVINEEMVTTAHWIADHVPPGDLIAIHDIGAVGYFTSGHPLLDIAGLISPEVIPIVDDADALWALMRQRGATYLVAFPDQIPGDDPSDPRLCRVFITNGTTSPRLGGPNMAVYALNWDGKCNP